MLHKINMRMPVHAVQGCVHKCIIIIHYYYDDPIVALHDTIIRSQLSPLYYCSPFQEDKLQTKFITLSIHLPRLLKIMVRVLKIMAQGGMCKMGQYVIHTLHHWYTYCTYYTYTGTHDTHDTNSTLVEILQIIHVH